MKNKLLELYTEDKEKFVKFVTKFYDEDELQLVGVNYYNQSEFFFLINKELASVYTVMEHVDSALKQHKVLKEFGIVED